MIVFREKNIAANRLANIATNEKNIKQIKIKL